MDKLTEPAFWNHRHDSYDAPRGRTLKERVLEGVRRTLGDEAARALTSYEDYLLWEVLLPKYLPKTAGLKVLEIGSAPGERLLRFREKFGYEPFGVEYAESGVRVNREQFAKHGVDPANVIAADFFSDEFQNGRAGTFDIVFSNGFIEHFSDPKKVVEQHVSLVKPGGHVVIGIPNLLGVNYLTTWLFDRSVLPVHNLEIMQPERFASLFAGVEPLYCDFYGTLRLSVVGLASRPWKERLRLAYANLQAPLNATFRYAFPEGRAESRWTSPYLLFVGRKKA